MKTAKTRRKPATTTYPDAAAFLASCRASLTPADWEEFPAFANRSTRAAWIHAEAERLAGDLTRLGMNAARIVAVGVKHAPPGAIEKARAIMAACALAEQALIQDATPAARALFDAEAAADGLTFPATMEADPTA